MPLRLIFMGTPDFAVPTLVEVGRGHEVVAVYTRAAKPAGRGMEPKPTPVEREARRLGFSVHTPTTLRTPEALAAFRAHGADAAVVVAYGLILPKSVLDAMPLGCFNLHASLLPRWRGAAPINPPSWRVTADRRDGHEDGEASTPAPSRWRSACRFLAT
jgi:methionyl-tRNA formyltransferase